MVLDTSTIINAILHTNFFLRALSIDVPEVEILRFLTMVVQADQGPSVTLTLSSFCRTETNLAWLIDRVNRVEFQRLIPADRVTAILTELAEASASISAPNPSGTCDAKRL